MIDPNDHTDQAHEWEEVSKDAQVSGFTADENQGETQESPKIEEPSDDAAKELKAAEKK